MSQVRVNVTAPGEIPVPNTGVFTTTATQTMSGSNNTNLFYIGAGIVIAVLLLAILPAIFIKKRGNKLSSCSFSLFSKKRLLPRIMALALLSFGIVFSSLKIIQTTSGNTNAIKGDTSALTVSAPDIVIDVDLEDDPVYEMVENTVTVDTATTSGYTLYAYIDNNTDDLSNNSDTITSLGTTYSTTLDSNSWGFALNLPEDQNSTVFREVPVGEENAIPIRSTGYIPTAAGDTTTLYYAAYITPEMSSGSYTGANIKYVAVPNAGSEDDIIVNYHGNGLYYDEDKAVSVNSVSYSKSCAMAYVGGNCKKMYTGTDSQVIKSPNLNDDGTQNGYYIVPEEIRTGLLTISGANSLRIELSYDINGAIIIAKGDEELVGEPAEYRVFEGQGEAEYIVNGDTASFGMFASEADDEHNYGYYAKVYPIYNERPEGIETTETTVCIIAKSENIDNEGTKVESYSSNEAIFQPLSFPGADRIRVEINYALTANTAALMVMEGYWNGDFGNVPDNHVEIYSNDTNLSGTKTVDFNGDTATFYMESWDTPADGFDYGFYARVYPIYDYEAEGSSPIQVCNTLTNKTGSYTEPLNYHDQWYVLINEDETTEASPLWFENESQVKTFLSNNCEKYKGQVVDVYARNYYTIHFDANGGVGDMMDQEVWLYDNTVLSSNPFTRTNYKFTGWNTERDGSGDSYAAGAIVYNLISGGETIVLYAQWLAPYTIHFDANGGEGTMTDQMVPVNTRTNLAANGFTRTNYVFDGWNTKADGSGDSYAAGAKVYNLASAGKTIVLYVQWERILEMQNIQFSSCTRVPLQVIDIRDGHLYTIQRLEDDNCWMMENLDLGRTALTTDLTSSNTNLAATVTAETFNSWKKTTGSNTYDAGEYISVSGTDATSGTAYGTLYNYFAASAGTISGSSSSNNASYDICPAGWRLPTGGNNGEFQALYEIYNSAALMRASIERNGAAFALAGRFERNNPAPHDQGRTGFYWSSTSDLKNMNRLLLYPSDIHPAWSDDRRFGHSIRCVVK